MKLGDGVFCQELAQFPELQIGLTVTVFKPGATSQGIWEDPTQPMNLQTYYRSHVAITGPFKIVMKFQDQPDEVVIIEQGKAWPHKEIPKGFRQVIGSPVQIELGGEHFCVSPMNIEKHSLAYQLHDIEKGKTLTVQPGNLLLATGERYSINGVDKSTIDSPWSITACVNKKAILSAHESCRVILYQAVPHADKLRLS